MYKLDEVELGNESKDDMESQMESATINQEDKALQQIVSCQIQPEKGQITHLWLRKDVQSS